MSELTTEIVFDIGDFSCDGHEKSVPIVVRCNRSPDLIAAAYHAACEAANFKLHDCVARKYEERHIKPGDYNRLVQLGWKPPADLDVDWLKPEDMLSMMFHMVRMQDPEFEYEIIEHVHFFKCGLKGRHFGLGYGLFV